MNSTQNTARAWPKANDYAAIHAEQRRRLDVFAAEPYTPDDCTKMFLFRAYSGGQETHRTRRVSTMLQFLVLVSAAALGGSCALNVAPGQFDREPDPDNERLMVPGPEEVKTYTEGQEIWRRSQVDERLEEWGVSASAVGDLFWEAVWSEENPDYAEYHALDPDTVKVWYDSRGKCIRKAVIEFEYTPEGATEPVKYKRTITADQWVIRNVKDENGQIKRDAGGNVEVVREKVQGRIVTDDGDFHQDVINTLGICTVVHYRWSPRTKSPQLSGCATTGYEDVVAKSDSASTQVSAIGTRHANPKTVTKGFQASDPNTTNRDGTVSSESAGIAPTIAHGETEEVYYLEASLTGVTAFRESTVGDMKMARDECPEFIMSESGANSSGTALSMRAAAFTGKYGPKQARFRACLAKLTSMCLCMQRHQPWSDEADIFVVSGSTPLPLDRAAELDVITKAKEARLLKQSDAIAAAQGLNIGPADADPTTYAEDIRQEDAALDAKSVEVATAIGKAMTPEAAAPAQDPAAPTVPVDATVQDTAMNGSQQTSLKEYLLAVADGSLDAATVIDAIMIANPNADETRVTRMVNRQTVRRPGTVEEISPALAAK